MFINVRSIAAASNQNQGFPLNTPSQPSYWGKIKNRFFCPWLQNGEKVFEKSVFEKNIDLINIFEWNVLCYACKGSKQYISFLFGQLNSIFLIFLFLFFKINCSLSNDNFLLHCTKKPSYVSSLQLNKNYERKMVIKWSCPKIVAKARREVRNV